jgi:hypothetical protein
MNTSKYVCGSIWRVAQASNSAQMLTATVLRYHIASSVEGTHLGIVQVPTQGVDHASAQFREEMGSRRRWRRCEAAEAK